MENVIVAAFETWYDASADSGRATSSFYSASSDGIDRVNSFVEDHHESNSYAYLHTFTSEEEAWAEYCLYNIGLN